MAIKVGITGGIGSGKSTICGVFKMLGVPVFEADVEAKQLLNSNPKIKTGLIDLFGQGIYMQNGTLDRKKLADTIFNDKLKLEKVNELVHPVVRSEFEIWAEKQKAAYVINEAAIMFETGLYKRMDYTILISAPKEERIRRVMKRDKISANQVLERMNKQWTDEQKRPLADLEFVTNDKILLIPQIIKIDKQLKEYGKIW